MTDELKPCPFCGSTNILAAGNDDNALTQCKACFCDGPIKNKRNGRSAKDRAIEAWNNRPTEDQWAEKWKQTIDTYESLNFKEHDRVEKLTRLLKRLEWDTEDQDGCPKCSVCGNATRDGGHKADCEVGQALEGVGETRQETPG